MSAHKTVIPQKKNRLSSLFFLLVIIITAIIGIYLLIHGHSYISRRAIRSLQRYVISFGMLSPLVIVFLIFLSTAIPPLPLPVPIIELAAGMVLGFWEGFFIVWISQIGSSLFAFFAMRYLQHRLPKRLTASRYWNSYREYINRKGAQAVFITRATMSSPFNIISFLSGLTAMRTSSFLLATAIGTIPESALYSLLGSQLRGSRLPLGDIFALVVIVGIGGFLFNLLTMRSSHPLLKAVNTK